jgi:phosphoribosylanthranilate isomerase
MESLQIMSIHRGNDKKSSMVRVKICGITNIDDAICSYQYGADALGFIFYKKSKRYINKGRVREILKNIPPFIETVGVFVNEEEKVIKDIVEYSGLDIIQLHGDESPDFCKRFKNKIIKGFRVKDERDLNIISEYNVYGILLDSYNEDVFGGSGRKFNWDIASKLKEYRNLIISGGLNPDNVIDAINTFNPCAVDVSSGVEIYPGKKDHTKLRDFIYLAKGYYVTR